MSEVDSSLADSPPTPDREPDAIPGRFRWAHIVLAGSMLVMGGCGMIYEYTLGVLGNNLMGSSREQIFVIIGLMMFAMGLGAAGQKQLVGKLIDKFLLIELLLGLLGGISTLVIYTAFVFTESYQVVMYGFAMIIGLLIGFELPLLIRINTQYSQSLRSNLSAILCMDYVGSLIGALLFAYVLITQLSVEQISLILGLFNTVLAMVGLLYFWPLVRHRLALMAACWGSLLVLGVGMLQGEGWMAELEQRCFEDPIIHSETSSYQHLVLTRRAQHTRLYIDGHLQFSSKDEAIYHELLVHVPMAVARQRERVLILGGGDGLALREVLKYGDVREVTLVDIDPAIIRLSAQQPDLIRLNQAAFHDARVSATTADGIAPGKPITVTAPSKQNPFVDRTEYRLADVRVFTVDADLFLRDVAGRYDVVIIDFPDPRSLELAKLYSVEFYRTLAQRMAPGAALAVQSTTPVMAPKVFRCIGRTFERAGFQCLPYHDHVPSFGEWGWYLAWRDGTSPQAVRQRLQDLPELPVPTRYLTPEVMQAAFVFGKDWRESADLVQANTKLRPVIVRYYSQGYE